MWFEEVTFRKIDDGFLFFPYAMMGKAYKISHEQKAELTRFLDQFSILSAFTAAIAVSFAWWAVIAVLVALWGYYQLRIKRILKDAVHTSERMTFGEHQRIMSRSLPRWVMFLSLAAGMIMTGGSAFLAYVSYRGGNHRSFLIGISCTILFGTFLALSVNVARLRLFPE